jgi:predicted HTH transcriptional regulator
VVREVSTEELAAWSIEGQTIECKSTLNNRDDGLKSLNAMMNADPAYGRVVFGLRPDGTVCGLEGDPDSMQRGVAERVRLKFNPVPHTPIEVVTHDRRMLLTVVGERPRSVVLYEYDGRAFIREGSSNRMLTHEERMALNTRRNRDSHNGPWRCDRCGTLVMHGIPSPVISNLGVSKTYAHVQCGGEFWPA